MNTMQPSRAEVRADLLALGLAATILFFLSLGARDLWSPNEPIYGQAVAEMAARGDWIVPTVNGNVFAEKPILYFWLARATSALLGGVGEFALRVPSALAGTASVLLAYLLVLPYAGRHRSQLAAALFATTFMVWWGARTVQMDLLVAAATLGVVLAVTRIADHGLSPWVGWPLAGFAAGLGFLAKGPVALVCPGAPLLLYLWIAGKRRLLRSPACALGAAAFVVTAAPWYLALLIGGHDDFLVEVLYRQNFTRFIEAWDHRAPWWYYLKYFWIDMAPWAWFVPLAIALPDRSTEEKRLDLLAWLWIGAVILFFSLSESKRSAYILPIAPAVAVLASGVVERLFDGRLGRARERACLVLTGFLGAVAGGMGIFFLAWDYPRWPHLVRPGHALGMLFLAGGAAIVVSLAFRRRARATAPAALFSLMLVVYVVSSVWILPAANPHKSSRGFCDRVAAVVDADAPLASYKFWRWRASYAYYLGRPIRNLGSDAEVREYWSSDERVFLIVRGEKLDEAHRVLGDSAPWVQTGSGESAAYLFSNP